MNKTKQQLARAAKVDIILRSPPPKTWSARMPAYCFTELCPVAGMRKGKGASGEY